MNKQNVFSFGVGLIISVLGSALALSGNANWALAAIGVGFMAITVINHRRETPPVLVPVEATVKINMQK